MSGHSKWSTIKHKKAAQDAKRGALFTKLIKEITIAARLGGGEPEGNPRLRTAIANAKAQSLPKENIERAIKKGTGDLEGVNYEEIVYEGYGPHNIAIIVETMTDNRNRTISSIRYHFNKAGGNLGTANSVQYLFERKGIIAVPKNKIDEDTLTELIVEAGADDIETNEENEFLVIVQPEDFEAVRNTLEDQEVTMNRAEVVQVPQTKVMIEDQQKAMKILKLIEQLENDEDVQNVFTNLDLSEELVAEFSAD